MFVKSFEYIFLWVFRFLNQRLTAPRWVNHRVWVGGAGVYWLLPPEPVGVACRRGAVRNRKTRWAASHRRAAPRHTNLWCTKPHHHKNETQSQQTKQTTTTTVSQNKLIRQPLSVNQFSIPFGWQSHIFQRLISKEVWVYRALQYMEILLWVQRILYTYQALIKHHLQTSHSVV